MNTVQMKLSELRPPERNVRLHTDKQLKEFKRSVDMFGQIRPIVIDENNVMLAGNGLYETLVSMGWETAACYVVTGLTEKEKKKLMLADNRIYSLGIDDTEAFDALIAELQDSDIPGYDEELINTLIASAGEVDDIISDYGSFSSDTQERIKKNEEPQAQPTTAAPADPPRQEPQTIENERFVICPKCGERIPV